MGCGGRNTRLVVMLMFSLSAQDADVALCRCEGGVELALQYAKMWCRYAKDLLTWIDKRISLGERLLSFLLRRHHSLILLLCTLSRSFPLTCNLTSICLTLRAYCRLHPFNELHVKKKKKTDNHDRVLGYQPKVDCFPLKKKKCPFVIYYNLFLQHHSMFPKKTRGL